MVLRRFNLEGKVALVTGGTGILGQHFCRGLAEAGANVVVLDLDAQKCGQLAGDISAAYGVSALGLACDVTKKDAVCAAVSEVVTKFGKIDILHNNAASKGSCPQSFFAPFEEFDLETWRSIMAVNVDGMFLMAQAVGTQMLQQSTGGSIIQTASIYGLYGPDQRIYEGSNYLGRPINTPAIYSASKAAVIGLTKYLATYWGHSGIRVNALTPGGVESGQNQQFQRLYSARVPMGRMARGEEIVGALIFLASDESSYITGQNIIIDGGLSSW